MRPDGSGPRTTRRAWLEELPHDDRLPTELGVGVPIWITGIVSRASAVVRGHGDGTARARVRTRRGLWLVCHASILCGRDGGMESVAVLIEPAKAADIASIVVEAYGLSERERQITSLISRGAATTEIARELYLSAHTVRDYVKAVFAKVGVSTRGELVAKLFAEHYEPAHAEDVVRILEDVPTR
jgi:DNA-binding CsgD family transcriptional regulator